MAKTKEEKLIELAENGGTDKDLLIFEEIEALGEKFDKTVTEIKESVPNLDKVLATIKGKDGESIKGDQGEKGEKGDKGEPGKNGKDGKNGRDGLDGRDGADGKEGPAGKNGLDGKDAEIPDLEELAITTVNYIETLEGDDRLSMSAVKDVAEKIEEVKQMAVANSMPVTTTHFFRDGIHFGRAKNVEMVHSKVEVVGDKAFITPIVVSDTAPEDPFLNQLWLDIS